MELSRITDDIMHWIARHLPRKLQYWAFINVWAHGTTGKYSDQEVPALLCVDALDRWQYPNK